MPSMGRKMHLLFRSAPNFFMGFWKKMQHVKCFQLSPILFPPPQLPDGSSDKRWRCSHGREIPAVAKTLFCIHTQGMVLHNSFASWALSISLTDKCNNNHSVNISELSRHFLVMPLFFPLGEHDIYSRDVMSTRLFFFFTASNFWHFTLVGYCPRCQSTWEGRNIRSVDLLPSYAL